MKKSFLLCALVFFLGSWMVATPAAAGGDESVQKTEEVASTFTLKMRILEGSRDAPLGPGSPVTSSFLKFLTFANVDAEEDVAAEQQIRKVYGLKDLSLLTEATLQWVRGEADKAFHIFRLNGQQYLVIVTPGRRPERSQFRIEVYEQSPGGKTNLLDTEFSLPDKTAAVFGFEDTRLKPYFISMRVTHWRGEPGVAGGGVLPGVVYPAPVSPTLRPAPAEKKRIKPPKLIKKVEPVYPEAARRARIEGSVIAEATTDTYGRIASVRILKSIPGLDQAAVDALKQWVYEPMVVDGQPRPVTFTVTMIFRLDKEKGPEVKGVVGGIVGGVVGGVEGGVAGGVEGGVLGGVLPGSVGGQELREFQGDAVRVLGDIKPPRLIKRVEPVYPKKARRAGVEGLVILEIKADEKGDIVDIRVLQSVPMLDQAAIDAVKQWKYEPLVVDGKARQAIFTVTCSFMLKEGRLEGILEKFTEGAVRAEGEVEPPKLVKKVEPVYPEAARQAGVEGTVILSIKTDEEGKVENGMVLRSVPLLDQAAIDAVKQWRYEPLVIDGKPRKVVFTVTVRFALEKDGRKEKENIPLNRAQNPAKA